MRSKKAIQRYARIIISKYVNWPAAYSKRLEHFKALKNIEIIEGKRSHVSSASRVSIATNKTGSPVWVALSCAYGKYNYARGIFVS